MSSRNSFQGKAKALCTSLQSSVQVGEMWWPFVCLTHAQVRCLQVKDFVYISNSMKCNKRKKKDFFIRKCIKYSSFQGPKEIG